MLHPCFQWQKFYGLEFTILISIQLASVVSVLFNAPRKSSSRSVRQLMKERELLIRSVVNLMLAVLTRSATSSMYVRSSFEARETARVVCVWCWGRD